MNISLPRRMRLRAALSCFVLLILSDLSAHGQYMPYTVYPSSSPNFAGPAQSSGVFNPGQAGMYTSTTGPYLAMPPVPFQPYFCPPHPCLPGSDGLFPGQTTPPGEPGMPSTQPRPGQPGGTTPPAGGAGQSEGTPTSEQEPSLEGVQAAAGGGGNAALPYSGADAGGYIDTALPLTQYRLRVDALNEINRPDRADYFYPKCGCFRANGSDPNAPGPGSAPADHVNSEILYNYLEIAPWKRFSAWIDVPYRWVDIYFTGGSTPPLFSSGWSDIMFGFKGAIIYRPNTVLTFQWRTYTPTGVADKGLGRNNWNLEPGFLLYQRLAPRLFFEGQIQDFIPVASADDFAGNVLNYGFALNYLLYNRPYFRILPVYEMLGWNVLSGKELTPWGVTKDAAGDTIVNAKFGVRFGFGQMIIQNYFVNRADLYLGYGRALTGDVWYKNMARAEFRIRF